MKLKKLPFVSTFVFATILIVGTTAFAQNSKDDGMGAGMMDNGMMKMMENSNMTSMMRAMNSPEGQKMMIACSNFMESNDNEEE